MMMEIDNGTEDVLVVIELEGIENPLPGSNLKLKNLDTAKPLLELEDGTILEGFFEETVGTQLIFGDQILARDGSHRVKLKGHTDKRIRFTKLIRAPTTTAPTDQQ